MSPRKGSKESGAMVHNIRLEENSPTTHLIREIRKKFPELPRIEGKEFREVNDIISEGYNSGRSPTDKEAKKICKILFPEEKPGRVVKTLVKGFRYSTRKGRSPAVMATGEHYQVIHSLQTGTIIYELIKTLFRNEPQREELKREHQSLSREILTAAILHDYLEDVPKEHQDLSMLENEVSHPRNVKRALKRLTIKEGENYFSGVERLVEEPHDESASIAILVKLADKISAAQTLSPFTIEKQLRIGGAKIWKVINLAREYARHDVPLRHEISDMTVLASISWWSAMRWATKQITNNLYLLYGVRPNDRSLRSKKVATTRKVHRYIQEGGLTHLEQETPQEWTGLAGTVYRTMLLGLPLYSERYEPPQHLWRDNENAEEARERMRKERDAYRKQLPLLPIACQKELFETGRTAWPHPEDVEKHLRRFPLSNPPREEEKEAVREGYQRVLLPFQVLQALSAAYTLDERFQLPNL